MRIGFASCSLSAADCRALQKCGCARDRICHMRHCLPGTRGAAVRVSLSVACLSSGRIGKTAL